MKQALNHSLDLFPLLVGLLASLDDTLLLGRLNWRLHEVINGLKHPDNQGNEEENLPICFLVQSHFAEVGGVHVNQVGDVELPKVWLNDISEIYAIPFPDLLFDVGPLDLEIGEFWWHLVLERGGQISLLVDPGSRHVQRWHHQVVVVRCAIRVDQERERPFLHMGHIVRQSYLFVQD